MILLLISIYFSESCISTFLKVTRLLVIQLTGAITNSQFEFEQAVNTNVKSLAMGPEGGGAPHWGARCRMRCCCCCCRCKCCMLLMNSLMTDLCVCVAACAAMTGSRPPLAPCAPRRPRAWGSSSGCVRTVCIRTVCVHAHASGQFVPACGVRETIV